MALTGYRKERPLVLGQHTCVSIARESGKWKDIPYLRENDGMLPPSMIVVGDRRRVISAAKQLAEPVLLHEEVEKAVGPHGSGRVNVAVGVFELDGKPLPLTILETQMGCSAQDINAWEALINSREDGYLLGGRETPGGSINAIRAGTCGGIIIAKDGEQVAEPRIEIGDVINAAFSIGDGSVVRQRMGFGSVANARLFNKFRSAWKERFSDSQSPPDLLNARSKTAVSSKGSHNKFHNLSYGFTKDRNWPVLDSSYPVVLALSASARELGLTCHEGGNFTKESLYLESDEEWVMDLRRKYGALSTEMEHFGLAFLTSELTRAGIPARNGLISCVVGTVPGGSFAAPGSPEEARAKNSENLMLKAAATALWKLAYIG